MESQNPQPTQPNQTLQPTQSQQSNQTNPKPLDYFNSTTYTVANTTCSPPEQKQIPQPKGSTAPPQYYHQIPLVYNFGSPENRLLGDMIFEACELTTTMGITSKIGLSGRMEHSLLAKFDMNNPEHVKCIVTFDQIHAACAYLVQNYKGAVKLYNFNAQQAEATGLKSLIYRARDQVTGELVAGKAPSMFFKLFSRGTPPFVEQTVFSGLDGKPVSWDLLRTVEMKFIPKFHIKRIYVSGKASIQMEMISAIITGIKSRGSTTRQQDTIDLLKSSRPELSDMVSSQLAKLSMDRQDQMLSVNHGHGQQAQGGADGGSQPTFAGIAGPTQQVPPPIPQMAPQGLLTQGPPSQGALPTMGDFTAGAPLRTQPAQGITMGHAGQLPNIPGIPGIGAQPIQLN